MCALFTWTRFTVSPHAAAARWGLGTTTRRQGDIRPAPRTDRGIFVTLCPEEAAALVGPRCGPTEDDLVLTFYKM